MPSRLRPLEILLLSLAGWLNRHQQDVIAYLQEENRVFKEHVGKRRLRLTDSRRRRLAAKGKAIGLSTLREVASIVSPDTIVDVPAFADTDSDTIALECDNCVFLANWSQHDLDDDDEGNFCDMYGGVIFSTTIDHPRVRWQSDPVYDTYNLYRGNPVEVRDGGPYSQVRESPDDYADRFCELSATHFDDHLQPDNGEVFFWLVTGEGVMGEESLGDGTTVNRLNDNPCP